MYGHGMSRVVLANGRAAALHLGDAGKRHLVTASAAADHNACPCPLLSLLPQAVLPAIVIVYLVGLIEPT
jgi:hypothetical protein